MGENIPAALRIYTHVAHWERGGSLMRRIVLRRTVAAAAAAAALLLSGCVSEGADGSDDASAAESGTPNEDGSNDEPNGGADEADGDEATEPAERVLFAPGDESDEVRELQARLAQLGFFTAQPTGFYGDITLGSVSEY